MVGLDDLGTRTISCTYRRQKSYSSVISISALIQLLLSFLGTFANLRTATISFFMSVRPSVRMEQFGCHWTDFIAILYFSNLRKTFETIQVSLKSN